MSHLCHLVRGYLKHQMIKFAVMHAAKLNRSYKRSAERFCINTPALFHKAAGFASISTLHPPARGCLV